MSEKAKEARYTLPLSDMAATEAVAFRYPKGNKTVYANAIADFVASGKLEAKVIIPAGMSGGVVYSGLKRAAKKVDGVVVNAHRRGDLDAVKLSRMAIEVK